MILVHGLTGLETSRYMAPEAIAGGVAAGAFLMSTSSQVAERMADDGTARTEPLADGVLR